MFGFKVKMTTAIYCPFCHSPLVEHSEPDVSEGTMHDEFYEVECKQCGAKGLIEEHWIVPKENQA